jgi:hypothetical protein
MAENVKDKDGNDIEIVIDENGKPVARPIDYKQRYEEALHLWHEAKAAYDQKRKRQDERAREALRILEITSGTGKRPIKEPCLKFLSEYEDLFVELQKRTIANKKKIIDDMAKKHKTTYGAIHKHIRDARAKSYKAIIA